MQAVLGVAPPRARIGRPRAAAWPAWLECLGVLTALAALWPAFAHVADLGAGRDRRFADSGVWVTGLPEPVLPALCAAYGAGAEAPVRERLCSVVDMPAAGAAAPTNRLPAELASAVAGTVAAFVAPLNDAAKRLALLRLQQRDGSDPLGASLDSMSASAAIDAEVEPWVTRFQLSRSGGGGPQPLRCAAAWVEAALAAPLPAAGVDAAARAVGTSASANAARANALLLLAAALDGRAATAAAAEGALLPELAPPPGCEDGPRGWLAATAALTGAARQSLSHARKNDAVLELMRSAGWQWAGAMLLGYGLLVWSRRARSAPLGVAAALALWALAGWAARVPWPFAAERGFAPARLEPALRSPPALFIVALAVAAALLWACAVARRPTGLAVAPVPARTLSSRVGYPGLVLATGLGWLLLLDLSANGPASNRYLALYHQGHLWLGMLVFSVLLFLRTPLSRGLAWLLSITGELALGAARRLGRSGAFALLLLATTLGVLAFGLGLANLRQLTSELGRVWLIIGAAWFFFLRAGPLAERLARSGTAGISLVRYLWPLLFVIGVLVATMLITHDMGPLLIAGYASGAFIGAAVAMWWHRRSGRSALAFGLAIVLFALWIVATTAALFELGAVDRTTAARLESVLAPYASGNDQVALVSWFQAATPLRGYGIGAVPWCGYAQAGGCSGVPAQIQSDYTYTAIVGVFGPLAAWAAALGCAFWLHRLIRHHGRVTRGEPRFVARAGGITNDGQALLSWIGLSWVVLTSCQLAITVAGNLAVLPLTGVTFPFVSFGLTSLLVNLAFLALCLSVDLPSGARDA